MVQSGTQIASLSCSTATISTERVDRIELESMIMCSEKVLEKYGWMLGNQETVKWGVKVEEKNSGGSE